MTTQTAQLWGAWIERSDEVAFEKLVRPELPAVYHLAQRMGLARADAEDVVQDALTDLAQTRTRKPGEVGVGAWLMRAVRMKSLMNRRSRARRARHEKAHPLHGVSANAPRLDLQEEVERALDQLEDDDRQVLVFRFLYDLDYREIAYVLGVSENACRIRVHRASSRLRDRIGHKAPALLAAIPLPDLPTAANVIASATQAGAAAAGTGSSIIGGLIVNTGMKMAASAVAAAALTAGGFFAFQDDEPIEPVPGTYEVSGSEDGQGVNVRPRLEPNTMVEGAYETTSAPTSGDGVITGSVTTSDGQPVEGVVVVAEPVPTGSRWSPFEAPEVPDIDEAAAQAAEETRRRLLATRRATSDANGRFELSALADLGFSIRAFAQGYRVSAPRGQKTWGVRPGGTLDFVAKAVCEVDVRILTADGSPPSEAGVIRARTEERLQRSGMSVWTADASKLYLEPGTWWIQGVSDRDKRNASKPQKITLEAGQGTVELVLRLEDRPGIRARVLGAADLDPTGMQVWILRFEGREPPFSQVGSHPDLLRESRPGKDGTYLFSDLERGSYVVTVVLGRGEPFGSTVVAVNDRTVDADVVLDPIDRKKYVLLRVLDENGLAPAPRDIRLSTSYAGERTTVGGGGSFIRRTDGSWWVAHSPMTPEPSEGKDGTYRITVSTEAHGEIERIYDPLAEREIEIRLAAPPSLTVNLTGLGELEGRVNVTLRGSVPDNHMSGGGARGKMLGATYTFEKVQPGDHILTLQLIEGDPPKTTFINVAMRKVTLTHGDNVVDWTLPTLHTLRVEHGDPEASIRFGLKCTSDAWGWYHQFANGEKGEAAEYRYVPPGDYVLEGSYKGETRRIKVNIPAQAVVRLD